MRRLLVVGLSTLAACSSEPDKEDKEDKEPEPGRKVPQVGELVRTDGGLTAVVTAVDPVGSDVDRHVDELAVERPVAPPQPPARPGKPIDVTLRSTPPGAQVAVDGLVIGHTPSFWSGTADGREHEFVFTMRGHAIARYRFVPISSGVIHGRLDPIHDDSDARAPAPPPEVAPPRPATTPSVNPPSAPPTIVPPGTVSVTPPGTPPPAAGSGSAPGAGSATTSGPGAGSGSATAPGPSGATGSSEP